MYCEDIDVCMRSFYKFGNRVLFVPSLRAVHLAEHASRSLFSPHFYWHIKSIFRYLRVKFVIARE